jgi:molecular chaperone DnaK
VLVGEAVEAILVDVIPHSLGISAAFTTPIGIIPGFFSVIIPRNSVVPVSRSEIYSTVSDGQAAVEIEVFQGENEIAAENVPLGSYKVEGLPPRPAGSIQIEVHFDFDLNGILTVTTTEKGKGQQGTLVVNHAGVQRLSSNELKSARAHLDTLFEADETIAVSAVPEDTSASPLDAELAALIERAQETLATLTGEQVEDLQALLEQLNDAIADGDATTIAELQEELADFLYYATTNTP